MPHRIEVTTDKAELLTKGQLPVPSGPGFTLEQLEAASSMELWGSSFNDPGDDWTEFRLLDAAGLRIAERNIAGY